jgi:hypothetical protein
MPLTSALLRLAHPAGAFAACVRIPYRWAMIVCPRPDRPKDFPSPELRGGFGRRRQPAEVPKVIWPEQPDRRVRNNGLRESGGAGSVGYMDAPASPQEISKLSKPSISARMMGIFPTKAYDVISCRKLLKFYQRSIIECHRPFGVFCNNFSRCGHFRARWGLQRAYEDTWERWGFYVCLSRGWG